MEKTPRKKRVDSHMILGYIFLLAVFAAIISGIYYWQTISQIPTSYPKIVHKNPTVGWKTYSNSQSGYSFKYQNNLEIIPIDLSQSGIDLGGDKMLNLANEISVNYTDGGPWVYDVSVYNIAGTESTDQVFENLVKFFTPQDSNNEYTLSDIHTSDSMVDNTPAKEIKIDNYGDHGNARIILEKGGKIYEISGSAGKYATAGYDIDTFASNFKFTQ